MSQKWECDRCKKLENEEMIEIKVPHVGPNNIPVDSKDLFKRNLCYQCHKDLVNFISGYKHD